MMQNNPKTKTNLNPTKKYTSIRLTEEAFRLWHELSRKLGVNLVAVLELAIRELAKQNGIEIRL